MRLLLAALFIIVAAGVCVSVASHILPKNTPPALTGILIGVLLIGLSIVALIVFNLGGNQKADPNALEKLQQQGLVESEQYEATRAFEVEEFEDEGMHYFIELKNGSVLFLSGQYLYDYPREVESPERFPCTKFTILRHKEKRFVLDLICEGQVIEPEFEAPHFSADKFGGTEIPEDGEIILDRSYDDIRAKHRSNV